MTDIPSATPDQVVLETLQFMEVPNPERLAPAIVSALVAAGWKFKKCNCNDR